MSFYLQKRKTTITYKVFSCLVAFTFLATSIIVPIPVYAKTSINLPEPGAMEGFIPTIINVVPVTNFPQLLGLGESREKNRIEQYVNNE